MTCLCGAPAVHLHHVTYRQHVRKHGGDVDAPANLLPLCLDCHGNHHSRSRVIPASKLPSAAVEFMSGLLGDAAQDYLARFYS